MQGLAGEEIVPCLGYNTTAWREEVGERQVHVFP
jgi:hypothetical protein